MWAEGREEAKGEEMVGCLSLIQTNIKKPLTKKKKLEEGECERRESRARNIFN